MNVFLKKSVPHVIAIAIFLLLTCIYFAPAVFESKTVHQVDMIHTVGMGASQAKQYEETAKPGEFSTWSDAMFGGMPYNAGYGSPAPKLPGIGLITLPIQRIGFADAGMVLTGLICFYILMCAMGINLWLAIAGSIAFAFASYNIIIIEVGHITKAYVIAYMPLTIAGMFLLFKRKRLLGSILFLLGGALSISGYHIQITYYLVLLCLFVYTGYLIETIRKKGWKEWGTITAIMAVCVFLSMLPNVQSLYTQWELGKTSLRGPTELTAVVSSGGEKISSGLDKDYAFQWSQGRGELLTCLIPNLYGGGSGGTLDRSSEFYQTLRRAGQRLGKDVQAPTYWGDKTFTSGPVYFGAVVCFLFVLGMFIIRNRMKWHFFAGAVFLTLLALGRNLDWFNTFFFHHLPMYSKFRTPEMALVIPGLVIPIIAFWGLKELVDGKVDDRIIKKGFIWALSVTGGICLIVWWVPDLFFSFQSPNYDVQYEQQLWYDGLVRDRAHLASADALRSLIFVLLSAALIFIFMQLKNKKQGVLVLGIGFTVLTLADLWPVDKRYLNDKDFVNEPLDATYRKSVADEEILKDKDVSYRVLTLNNPFQETTVSYYHHSIGGYHAVKLRRYQELIDYRLSGEIGTIIESFRKPEVTLEDIQQSFASTPSLNMLNTRYIIYNPEHPPVVNPRAFGNAWFVRKAEIVENADAEIAALNTIDPLQTAVVDKRFADDLKGFTAAQPDSAAKITLDSYRPNHLIYTSKANSGQLAVFSEIYYQPGWKATIDGHPASHFRADWILRAMLVPAGEHRIEFDFRSEIYVATAYTSAIGSFLLLLLVIAGVGYSIWRERK